MQIIPAILTNDLKDAEEKIRKVELALPPVGIELPRIQIDVIDGVYAENKTVSLEGLAGIENSASLDVHLMVKEPIAWVEKSVRAHTERIIGQIEMMESQVEFVNKVIEVSMLPGLAIDLGTPVSQLDETILLELDTVLVMAVKAGFGGQEFEDYALDKVKELKELREANGYRYKICVDGGVEVGNIKRIADAGADEAAAGSSLFEGDVKENINKFKEAIN